MGLQYPWWLLLLLLIPIVIVIGAHNLQSTRRWIALGTRCLLILLLAFALAEPRWPRSTKQVTVLFVLDRSLSVPVEQNQDDPNDQRWQRIRKFLNDSVANRPGQNMRDRAGLIAFGRRPRLELLPTDAPRFNLLEISSPIDRHATDIGAAIQLALASFPEDSAKRIVLISDGNQNHGDALEQAQLARSNGVQIDIVPLAANQRQENEVLIERIQAPRQVEQGSQVPLTVWVRSYSRKPVEGILVVRQKSRTETREVVGSPRRVQAELGLNRFVFQQALATQQASYTYEAIFQPLQGLKGDRPQNNQATTHVIARGRRRVLLIEEESGKQSLLVNRLRASARSRMEIIPLPVQQLAQFSTRERLAAFLSNFDCVILADVPAESITEQQQEVIRANTHDQGCGLVMIGGPQSFGAGGWQNTPVEKALPVDAQIKGLEVAEKSGLVLIMHASEMARGNSWQKKIGKLAVERLGPGDEIGVLVYDWNMKWHIPLQQVGTDRDNLYRKLDRMEPGDMPDFDPGLQLAQSALTEKDRGLATKHVIIITDGDPRLTNFGLLTQMRQNKITVSTVGVATHGPASGQYLRRIARATGGRFYLPRRPTELPAIYIRETRQVSQAFIHRKRFKPQLVAAQGPAKGLDDDLPTLKGFVRTTAKPENGVSVPIWSPKQADMRFPILAYWRYGLGTTVAFTSDAGSSELWSENWIAEPLYARFWEQVFDYAMRPIENENLTMRAYYHDGQIRVIVQAKDEQGKPDINLTDLQAEVTLPRGTGQGVRKPQLRFEQKSSGLYEATFPTEQSGSYFIGLRVTRRSMDGGNIKLQDESVRASVTIPYAPEFADMESNVDLLERIRQETGGERFDDDAETLTEIANSGQVFRPTPAGFTSYQPMWHWLLYLAAIVFLIDVAIRRIAFERIDFVGPFHKAWLWLRGREEEEQTPQFFERLKNRKAQIGERLSRPEPSRKFENQGEPMTAPSGADTSTAPLPTSKPPSSASTSDEDDEDDFAARLLKAKKRIQEERDNKKN